MMLAKIKEALAGLYEEIPTAMETVEAEAAPEEATAEQAEQVEEAAPEAAEAAGTAEKAEEPATPPGPKESDYTATGCNLDAELPPEKIVAAVEILNREDFFLETITGVDWIDAQQMEVIYDFNHFDENCRVVLRSRLDRSKPEIPTISHIYQGANWHERETHDFFGIVFTGHPNLEPLLLPEDADFHPLLKDFKA